MRIIVCGGRDYKDEQYVWDVLFQYIDWNLTIIEGGAKGADRFAANFARYYNVHNITFHANWKLYGKRAGPLRNIEMLKEGKPDLVIAFPGGKGTAHMVRIALEAGIEVKDYRN